ncbi:MULTISPECIES: alkaline phosphatase family protein [unclassified Bacillus (in: firmicutes)]|uniref:alkaline phosphatase family protein n=1 Tax=unclassified Bacillus (in: firmicutes) TaxID=185979 RepID=UPI001BEB0BC1|nr:MULTISPECIES: alkaline phosphatase family protein [unclassified Bacillus (in: firmicutes)]MBT2640091.1 alkaline phosphatase family protein [Bacillus sp. ISL-39]MBT2659555.1 alkaline phosphatase family protein [Bacillus sp. ISL-45]
MKFLIPLLLLIIITVIAYIMLIKSPNNPPSQLQQQQQNPPPSKRVVMIVVDSLMDQPLQSSLEEDKVSALRFLINHGKYYPEMVSAFPTMSVVIDSTLLTGTYADQHKVPALVWYDSNEKRFISYGSAQKEIRKLGVKQVLENSLFQLNHRHLSPAVKTIHEELKGQSASINTLVYRGGHSKPLSVPRGLSWPGLVEEDASIKGPEYFSYGLLSKLDPKNPHTHLWQGFGFNDQFAAQELKYLIKHNRLPSYSLVYFSDNDKQVHKKGVSVTKGIEDADKQLQEILNTYPAWEEALNDTAWIIMGDSGQTDLKNDKEQALIDLRVLLKEYRIHKIDGPVKEKDQIVLGLNERMTFIYLLDQNIKIDDLSSILSKDRRIDQIAWKQGESVKVISGDHSGYLLFKPNGDFADQYGKTWCIEGNFDILDLEANGKNQIEYNDYPDGLARLYSSFYSHSGIYMVVNAKPGYEFVGEESPTHVGGAAHGSLHKQDTFFPVIVAGTEQEPQHERIMDFKEWVMRILESPELKKSGGAK